VSALAGSRRRHTIVVWTRAGLDTVGSRDAGPRWTDRSRIPYHDHALDRPGLATPLFEMVDVGEQEPSDGLVGVGPDGPVPTNCAVRKRCAAEGSAADRDGTRRGQVGSDAQASGLVADRDWSPVATP